MRDPLGKLDCAAGSEALARLSASPCELVDGKAVSMRIKGDRASSDGEQVPSLATLTTASVIAVAALVASVGTGTGTPSAQARVAAAAGRTATGALTAHRTGAALTRPCCCRPPERAGRHPPLPLEVRLDEAATSTSWLHCRGLKRWWGPAAWLLPSGGEGRRAARLNWAVLLLARVRYAGCRPA